MCKSVRTLRAKKKDGDDGGRRGKGESGYFFRVNFRTFPEKAQKVIVVGVAQKGLYALIPFALRGPCQSTVLRSHFPAQRAMCTRGFSRVSRRGRSANHNPRELAWYSVPNAKIALRQIWEGGIIRANL